MLDDMIFWHKIWQQHLKAVDGDSLWHLMGILSREEFSPLVMSRYVCRASIIAVDHWADMIFHPRAHVANRAITSRRHFPSPLHAVPRGILTV